MNLFYKICILLIIVGGLNWGLVGLFDFNAVAWLFGGAQSMFARAIFTLVGVAAICAIPSLFTGMSNQSESSS